MTVMAVVNIQKNIKKARLAYFLNYFVTNAEVKNVSIGTEQVETEQGEKLNVSSIEIILGKK